MVVWGEVWGEFGVFLGGTGTFPPTLQCANVTLQAEQRCLRAFPELFSPNMICAAGSGAGGGNTDACQVGNWDGLGGTGR